MAVVSVVEPEPALDIHRPGLRRRGLVALQRRQFARAALRIGLHDARAVGVDAVQHHLDLGRAEPRLAGEILADVDDAIDLALQHQFPGGGVTGHRDHVEVGRQREAGREIGHVGRWGLE